MAFLSYTMSTADALQAWAGGLITSQGPPGVPLAVCIALVTSVLYGLYRLCGDKDGLRLVEETRDDTPVI